MGGWKNLSTAKKAAVGVGAFTFVGLVGCGAVALSVMGRGSARNVKSSSLTNFESGFVMMDSWGPDHPLLSSSNASSIPKVRARSTMSSTLELLANSTVSAVTDSPVSAVTDSPVSAVTDPTKPQRACSVEFASGTVEDAVKDFFDRDGDSCRVIHFRRNYPARPACGSAYVVPTPVGTEWKAGEVVTTTRCSGGGAELGPGFLREVLDATARELEGNYGVYEIEAYGDFETAVYEYVKHILVPVGELGAEVFPAAKKTILDKLEAFGKYGIELATAVGGDRILEAEREVGGEIYPEPMSCFEWTTFDYVHHDWRRRGGYKPPTNDYKYFEKMVLTPIRCHLDYSETGAPETDPAGHQQQ